MGWFIHNPTHIYVCFILMSGIVLAIYHYHPKKNDIERFFLNNREGKLKYYILLYAKFIIIFAFIYNLKYVLLTYLNKI
jgi:hypothetical protein